MTIARLRIGTRGSPLALIQAEEVKLSLAQAHNIPLENLEIVPIKTSGDAISDRPLNEIGGKGLFTKEIDNALLAVEIDLAVHSAKDLATALPAGIVIAATPPREDVRDAFISLKYKSLEEMPEGAVIGTASLRRSAQALSVNPKLKVVPFRGNLATRLKKLEAGEADATFLAVAGLKRARMTQHITSMLAIEEFLPACGQGTLAICARADDPKTLDLLKPLNHFPTKKSLSAERAFLALLDGSCRTPIGGFAEVKGTELIFKGAVYSADGKEKFTVTEIGKAGDDISTGKKAGEKIRATAGEDFFAQFIKRN